MKHPILLRAFACVSAVIMGLTSMPSHAADTPKEPISLCVMTFNVLVNIEKKPNVPAWDDRKALCAQVVQEANADLIGLQETSPTQVAFFKKALPNYGAVGAQPLTDKDMAFFDAHVPVFKTLGFKTYTDAMLFYNKAVFEKLDEGHWWLSPTPDKLSTGFGNTMPRLVVWAHLRNKATGRELFAVNTHFDNTMPSQVKMAKLCHERLKGFESKGLPIIFTGDFNTNQKRGDYATLASDGWRDSYLASDKASPTGRDSNVATTDDDGRIDHIFYYGKGLKPISWERLESPDPAKRLSDHWPVEACFEWR